MSITDTTRTIAIFNKICYIISALSLTLGMVVFYVINYELIFYIELFIGLSLLTVPVVSKTVGLQVSMTAVFIILCAALVFYGVILGPVTQIHILVGFLVGAALLLIKNRIALIVSISYVLSMVIFLEISYYNSWFTPIPMNYHTQMLVRWIVIFTGITLSIVVIYFYVKEWANAKVEKLLSDLQKANASKSLYVRQTSHELRMPLTNIHHMCRLLMDAGDEDKISTIRPIIEDSFAASNQSLQVINNILELSKIEAGILDEINISSFSFRPWLHKNIDLNQYSANTYNIKFDPIISKDMPATLVNDPNKLNQILNNLLSNAIKFSGQDTTVIIKVGMFADTSWQMQVIDHGPGMDELTMSQIFDPFMTKGNSADSSGLGLTITSKLVQNLNGSIKVESKLGIGTTFTVRFPLITMAKEVPIKPELSPAGDYSKKKVLVIEDDLQNRRMIEHFLKPLFGVVLLEEKGKPGLALAREMLPDLIVLDLGLPDIAGKEVLQMIKNDPELKDIEVLIVSGDLFNEVKDELIKEGALGFIGKPFDRNQFNEAISNSLKLRKAG